MYKHTIFLFLGCLLYGCAPAPVSQPCERERFSTPIWVDSLNDEKTEAFTANCIGSNKPIFMGIYDFGDSIFVPIKANFLANANKYVENYTKNRAYFENFSSDGLELIVDTINAAKVYNGVQTNNFTPIYIVNSTLSSKHIIGRDYEINGLQEAVFDSGHSWIYPIEGEVNHSCGCCPMFAELKPKQFAVILVKKYTGKFKTHLRTRLSIDGNIYITKLYTGCIDTMQFYFSPKSLIKKRIDEKDDRIDLFYDFYGSVPLEVERERWK